MVNGQAEDVLIYSSRQREGGSDKSHFPRRGAVLDDKDVIALKPPTPHALKVGDRYESLGTQDERSVCRYMFTPKLKMPQASSVAPACRAASAIPARL